jgi:hypothetical protein
MAMDILTLIRRRNMILDQDITDLDLECIAYKVCRDERWNVDYVDRVELNYRAFLQLVRNAGSADSVAPTMEVDIFWHHHILDTYKYHRDCQNLFGNYLHHYPYSGIFGDDDRKLQTERVVATRERIAAIVNEGSL